MDEILQNPALWLPAGVGVLLLVGGWLAYWASLYAIGGSLLGGAGLLAGSVLGEWWGLEGPAAIICQGGFALGGLVLGIIVMRFLHRLAFFLVGCGAGGAIFVATATALRNLPNAPAQLQSDAFLAFGAPFAALLAGLLLAAFANALVIWITALTGAALLMMAFDWPMMGLPGIAATLVGGLFQEAVFRGRRKNRRAREDD